MSSSDILQLYHERFGRLPDAPKHLMSFSRQISHLPTLKWIEAKRIINDKQYSIRFEPKKPNLNLSIVKSIGTVEKSSDQERVSTNTDKCSKQHSINHSVPVNFKYASVIVTPPILSPVIAHSPLQTLPQNALHSFPYTAGGILPHLHMDLSVKTAPIKHQINTDTEDSMYDYDNYNTNVIISTSDTSSFDSGHGNIESTNSLTNNNETNNDDSDVNDSLDSGCPIYHDEDVYGQNVMICDEERSVFESLQHKLIEMDDFSRDYLDLRSNYLVKKRKIDKNGQINLNLSKQKIAECFNELYILLKERENVLLFELDEMYKAQTVINTAIDFNLEKLLSQHMAYISHKITMYQSLTNATKSYERKKRIIKIGNELNTEHRSQMSYFNSIYDEMKHKLQLLNDEKYIDFVPDDNIHYEFGRIMSNIPKPAINHIQILGNDLLNMELSHNKGITTSKYQILTYQISYCYHSTINFENIDEKQDKMQWENVEIDCYQQHNPYLIEFEIDDLNLVNADLMIKMRYLLKRDNIKMWTVCSDIYQLTQSDLYKSMSNIVPCLDDDSSISPLFKASESSSDTAQTVCYKQEFEDDMNITDINDDDDDTDDTDDHQDDMERETHHIDIVPFKKDLYFDQSELDNEMAQNQQLIQEFMKGINAASKVNNRLIKSIKGLYKQRELWMNNKLDISNMKKKPKLALLSTNSFIKNGKHTACKSSSTLSLTNSSSCSDDTSFKFTHSFNKISKYISSSTSNNNKNNIDWNKRMEIYGELCHILQENPAYLSRLTRLIDVRDIAIWCKTIVCDLFGNECDTRNEHLLLRIFECIFADYCADAKDIDLFLVGDNIITGMIACFMNDRCEDNIATLKMIFEGAIKELIFDNEQQLNLEIDPIRVYREISIAHTKDSTNTSNPMLKIDSLNSDSVDTDSSDDDVNTIIGRRIEQIEVIVAFFLDRMIENARIISFGIRWICKVIASCTSMAFPDSSTFELNALIGKVVYILYFESALNAPYDFLNIASVTKNAIIMNNFSIICQILRSILCNERFNITNTRLLHWIKQQQIETAPIFYEKLLDLPNTELNDRLNVDSYLISCKHDVQLSLKQIYLLHRELYRNQEIWSNDYNHNIPLFDVLDRLEGDAPYKYDEEKVVILDLTVIETSFNPFFVDTVNTNSEYSLDTLNQSDSGFVNVQYNENHSYESEIDNESQLKCDDEQLLNNDESYIYNLLFSIKYKDDDIMGIRHSLKELLIHKNVPQHIIFKYRHSLKEFLNELRNWSLIHDCEIMLALIDSILERMDRYRMKHNVNGYNSFIYGYHCDIKKVINFSKRLQLKAVIFAKARDAMIDHTNYLENKLQEYKQLLQHAIAMITKFKKHKKAIKIPYKNLLNQSVIIDNNNDDENNNVFHFVHQSLDCFQLQIVSKSKKSNDTDLKPSSSTLSLLKLLEMREANHSQFLLSSFTFHIDGTINLLNGIIANKV